MTDCPANPCRQSPLVRAAIGGVAAVAAMLSGGYEASLAAPARPDLPVQLAQLQHRSADDELPQVNVGPPPAAKPPAAAPGQSVGSQQPPPPDKPVQLQLRVDPETGKPLSARQLRDRSARERARPAPGAGGVRPSAPRSLGRHDDTGSAAAAASDEGSIQVRRLAAVDPSSVGLLDESNGGFSRNFWAGVPRRRLVALLPQLPVQSASPTVQDLTRRLLLTAATVPAGDAGAADLLAMRLDLLQRSGRVIDARNLMRLAPRGNSSDAMAKVRLNGLMLAGAVGGACKLASNMLQTSDAPVWQMTSAFCLALDGRTAQVELIEQLLYDRGIRDPAYYGLLGSIARQSETKIETVSGLQPLHLAMLRASRATIPEIVTFDADPSILRAVATSPNTTLTTRLEAAERAAAIGNFDLDTLQQIYASVPFTEDQRANALELARQTPGPLANAILYQVAQIETEVVARARALQAAWANGRFTGRYFLSVTVNKDALQTIQPAAELDWFAADAGRAHFAAGNTAAARAWMLAMLQPAQAGVPAAAVAVLALTPLAYVADAAVGIPVVEAALRGWWQGAVAEDLPDRVAKAEAFYLLLEAFGHAVPDDLWDALLTDRMASTQKNLSTAAVRALQRAAEEGRTGEVLLISLVALGDRDPDAMDPLPFAQIVGAVNRVGLGREAHALALEGLLGRNF